MLDAIGNLTNTPKYFMIRKKKNLARTALHLVKNFKLNRNP